MFLHNCIFLLSTATVLVAYHLPHRIIGGSNTSIKKAPWQVSLQYRGQHFCGGVIYNSNIILTAAHCVAKVSADSVRVRVGSANKERGGRVYSVQEIIAHEQFNSPAYSNDIAVLSLVDHITFNDKVRPIQIAEEEPESDELANVTGWGITENDSLPITLQNVDVRIVSNDVCREKFGYLITDNMICAGREGETSCQGDSGGPLVVNGELVGVVSFGLKFCSSVSVYTNVVALRPWIEEAVAALSLPEHNTIN
ncbi:trypsin delta/gamma-like protein CG30031 [Scaptodrosophila lebanonensis]|uniref:trypsin n=1 Tax=Drosophila lebanonensis TaxID=7225 RepID=A0A6J2U977_DROLE|nr:trypsin delta/gamma-like protein CG30031 [Scaptodrosophila lebanonensis]